MGSCTVVLILLFMVCNVFAMYTSFGLRRGDRRPVVREGTQVIEVIRWRQPVCIAPAEGITSCQEDLRQHQTHYEQVNKEKCAENKTDKSRKIEESSGKDRVISSEENEKIIDVLPPTVISPGISGSISIDDVEFAELDITESTEGRTMRLRSKTPEINDENLRRGKYLIVSSPEVKSSLEPQIYVTKVLDVPVTATLIAQNCLPDIGVPLCDGWKISASKTERIETTAAFEYHSDKSDEGKSSESDRISEISSHRYDGYAHRHDIEKSAVHEESVKNNAEYVSQNHKSDRVTYIETVKEGDTENSKAAGHSSNVISTVIIKPAESVVSSLFGIFDESTATTSSEDESEENEREKESAEATGYQEEGNQDMIEYEENNGKKSSSKVSDYKEKNDENKYEGSELEENRRKESKYAENKYEESNREETHYEENNREANHREESNRETNHREESHGEMSNHKERHREESDREASHREMSNHKESHREESHREANHREESKNKESHREESNREANHREESHREMSIHKESHREESNREANHREEIHREESNHKESHRESNREVNHREESDRETSHREETDREESNREASHREESHREMSNHKESHRESNREVNQREESHREMSNHKESHREESNREASHREESNHNESKYEGTVDEESRREESNRYEESEREEDERKHTKYEDNKYDESREDTEHEDTIEHHANIRKHSETINSESSEQESDKYSISKGIQTAIHDILSNHRRATQSIQSQKNHGDKQKSAEITVTREYQLLPLTITKKEKVVESETNDKVSGGGSTLNFPIKLIPDFKVSLGGIFQGRTMSQKPENDISNRGVLNVSSKPEDNRDLDTLAKPTEKPGLFGGLLANPTKPLLRAKRDVTMETSGGLRYVHSKRANEPLLINRPNEKPLFVQNPVYVVEKPSFPGFFDIFKIFKKPDTVPEPVETEVIAEPVYIYYKPSFLETVFNRPSKPSFFPVWNIFDGFNLKDKFTTEAPFPQFTVQPTTSTGDASTSTTMSTPVNTPSTTTTTTTTTTASTPINTPSSSTTTTPQPNAINVVFNQNIQKPNVPRVYYY